MAQHGVIFQVRQEPPFQRVLWIRQLPIKLNIGAKLLARGLAVVVINYYIFKKNNRNKKKWTEISIHLYIIYYLKNTKFKCHDLLNIGIVFECSQVDTLRTSLH